MKQIVGLLISLVLVCSSGAYGQNSTTEFVGLKSINGTDLFLKIMGEGEPLLIIHGGPGLNHSYFLPHLEPLAEDFRLIFYDQRGSGRSSVELDSTQMSLDLFIEDIESIRKELKVGNINLLGHSWGGFLAMNYAIRYPERLSSLILSNTTPASSKLTQQMMQNQMKAMTQKDSLDRASLMNSKAFKEQQVSAFEKLMKLSFRLSFRDPNKLDQLNIDLGENYLAGSRLLQHLGSEITSYDLYPELDEVNVPTLLIRGEADLIPFAADQKLYQILPNVEMVIFKRSGHFPFVEEPDRFRALLTDFLRR